MERPPLRPKLKVQLLLLLHFVKIIFGGDELAYLFFVFDKIDSYHVLEYL